MKQKVKHALNECATAAKSIDQLATEISREHKIMFGALASIKADSEHTGKVLKEGSDYLTALLDFRRRADEKLAEAWELLGL